MMARQEVEGMTASSMQMLQAGLEGKYGRLVVTLPGIYRV
jgi:hypothetical protein